MKKKIVASILFFILCIASTVIYAAIDAKAEINSSSLTVKPGDEVTFVVKVKDIISDNGINGIEGTISYSTDVFEDISDGDVTKAGAWDVAYYNKKVIAEGLTSMKENTDVINIKLKVKNDSNVSGKTGKVELKDTSVYNTETLELGTISASVKIEGSSNQGGSESTPTPSPTGGTTNNTPTPTANNNQNSGSNQGNLPITNIDTNTSSGGTTTKTTGSGTTAKTTSSSSLPKAGIGSTIAVLLVIVTGIGIVSYIKLKKYKEI